MKRIFVDARVGWGSGIGRYITNTVADVAALRPSLQFDVLVNAHDEPAAQARFAVSPNIRVATTDIEPFTPREQWALSGLAKGYDLTWFTNYWVPLSWSGPYLAVVHDLLHLRPDLFPVSPVKRTLSSLTFKKIAGSAKAISFGSRFSQREFESRYGKAKVAAVHSYGIDHAGWVSFDPENPPAKEKLILAVGAAKKHKNFDIVFEAWRKVRLPEGWKLTVICPDARLRSGIDLEELSVGSRPFDLRRGVSNEELRDLYARAAVLLMPSFYEGFGLPLMEGLQAGALCIASTAESMVEIAGRAHVHFVNGRDLEGWVDAIEHAMQTIDEGRFVSTSLQRDNMAHALTYNWQSVAQITAQLIDDALAA